METLTKKQFIFLSKEAEKNDTIEVWCSLGGYYKDEQYEEMTYDEYIKFYEIEEDELIFIDDFDIDPIYDCYLEAIEKYKKDKKGEIKIRRGDWYSVTFEFKNNQLKSFKEDEVDDERLVRKYIFEIDEDSQEPQKQEPSGPLASANSIANLLNKYK